MGGLVSAPEFFFFGGGGHYIHILNLLGLSLLNHNNPVSLWGSSFSHK